MKLQLLLRTVSLLSVLAIGVTAQSEIQTSAASTGNPSTKDSETVTEVPTAKNPPSPELKTKSDRPEAVDQFSNAGRKETVTGFTDKQLTERAVVNSIPAAQTTDEEYHKGEVYLGYSGAIVVDDEFGFEGGVNVSGVYYFHRYIGAKADFSATFQPISGGDHSLYNLTGGVQFKDSSKSKKFKPFGHALAGVAFHKDTNNAFPQFGVDSNGLSLIFGAGLDIKVTDNIDIRAFQLDINPIFTQGFGGSDITYINIRYGAGIVFNF
jgi:hypothetical protein